MTDLPYSLLAELEKVPGKGRPPVHLWHPEHEEDIDIIIQRDGTWLYAGTPIKRPRLVRLFASVLRREGDAYFLVTPVEKCRITVEDAPFQAVLMEVTGEGEGERAGEGAGAGEGEGRGESRNLHFTTDMGEKVLADADHALRIVQSGDEWIPYLHVRDGLEARLSRNVYYQLADLLEPRQDPNTGENWLGVWSGGTHFPLMRTEP